MVIECSSYYIRTANLVTVYHCSEQLVVTILLQDYYITTIIMKILILLYCVVTVSCHSLQLPGMSMYSVCIKQNYYILISFIEPLPVDNRPPIKKGYEFDKGIIVLY